MGEQGLHAYTPHGDRALRCGRRTGIFTALPVPRTRRGNGGCTGLPPRRVPVAVTPRLASPPWGLIPPTSLSNLAACGSVAFTPSSPIVASNWQSWVDARKDGAVIARRDGCGGGSTRDAQHMLESSTNQKKRGNAPRWRYGGAEAGRRRTRGGRSGVPQAALPAAPKLNKTVNPPLGGGE